MSDASSDEVVGLVEPVEAAPPPAEPMEGEDVQPTSDDAPGPAAGDGAAVEDANAQALADGAADEKAAEVDEAHMEDAAPEDDGEAAVDDAHFIDAADDAAEQPPAVTETGMDADDGEAAEEDDEPPPTKPRRANSAWGLYLSQVHAGKISSKASEQWKALADDERAEYVEGAAADKVRYEGEKAAYEAAFTAWQQAHPIAAARLGGKGKIGRAHV